MLTKKLVAVLVGLVVLGLVGSAGAAPQAQQADHNTILNAVTSGDSALGSQHTTQAGAQSALSQKVDDVKTAVDNLSTTTDLRGVTQNWDKTLPANDPGGPCPSNSSRFTCVFGGGAVRDNETGLVWEKSPDTADQTWHSARFSCLNKGVGGLSLAGWRLPSVVELMSLVDRTQAGPTLSAGHPFTNVSVADSYWSATTDADGPTFAWLVGFGRGNVDPAAKAGTFLFWCVRGGMNADQY